MSDDVFIRLVEQIEATRGELQDAMADPGLVSDRARFAEVNRRWSALTEAFALVDRWRDATARAAEARELLAEDDDDDVRSLLREAEDEQADLEPRIREAMVEPDPNDGRDVIVEIRAAAGGEEAALFARDLLEVYARYADQRGFRMEPLSTSPADAGGVKEVTFAVKGDGAFSVFKHEAGVHRVQRVPDTESQGRIHTSTATVAVLPEPEEVDVKIDWNNDVEEFATTSQGPGGQNVNKVATAVQIKHKPSGIIIRMMESKSQQQNRERARRLLITRLHEIERQRKHAERSAARKDQIGGGERSEKIRTYRYKEAIVADERLPDEYPLRDLQVGDFAALHQSLIDAETARRLQLL